MGDVPASGGRLDPDRAFSVPHTAESARQTNAPTFSARERQHPQSGGEPSTVAAPAHDRRSACSQGSTLPNFVGRADPTGLTLRKGPLDEGVAPLATATGNPTPNGEEMTINQHPPTTATGIPGPQPLPRLPGDGQRMRPDQPADILGPTGAFMRYSNQGAGEATGNPTMMRGSHALLCPPATPGTPQSNAYGQQCNDDAPAGIIAAEATGPRKDQGPRKDARAPERTKTVPRSSPVNVVEL